MMKRYLFALVLFALWPMIHAAELSFKVTCKYLNLPISQQEPRCRLHFQAKGIDDLSVVARLSARPEYWVFKDLTAYKGKTLTLSFDGDEKALAQVYQADTIRDVSYIYKEAFRPQFHFTSRRGWLNDPNGCIWHDGLYHLYYQHNPFEREWENMTWGHATSPDLLHWTEQPPVLHPDSLGTMYSGSAVFDKDNTSGFGTKDNPPIVYAYTADRSEREVQCIAYSLDGGMTLHKYEGNPVIDSHDKWQTHDTRDPRLLASPKSSPKREDLKSPLPFRGGEGGEAWVLVFNERNGHNIIDYDLNRNTINGQPYSPQDPTSLSLTMDVYIDRTSVEVFIDDGLYSFSAPLPSSPEGTMFNVQCPMFNELSFWGTDINVTNLRIDAVKSIWE